MSPIKDFKLRYEALNKEGIFSEGDTVAGTVTFTLTEETKMKSLVVKVKGEARVHWTEGTGDRKESHSDHRRYFKDKEYLLEEKSKSRPNTLGQNVCRFKVRGVGLMSHNIVAYFGSDT